MRKFDCGSWDEVDTWLGDGETDRRGDQGMSSLGVGLRTSSAKVTGA